VDSGTIWQAGGRIAQAARILITAEGPNMSREQLAGEQNQIDGGRPYAPARPTTYGLPPELAATIHGLAREDEEKLWALVEANPGWAQQIMSLAAHDMSGTSISRVRTRWAVAHGRVTRGGGKVEFDANGEVSLDGIASGDASTSPAAVASAPTATAAAEVPAFSIQSNAPVGLNRQLPQVLVEQTKALVHDVAGLERLIDANPHWSDLILSLAKQKGLSPDVAGELASRRGAKHGAVSEVGFTADGEVTLDAASAQSQTAEPSVDASAEQGASSSAAISGPTRGHVTATRLNVRSTPDTKSRSNVLGGLDRGEEIEVLGAEGAWLKIMYRGQLAYVHSSYVAMSQPGADAVASTSSAGDLDDV
jgi:hypothetical protein